MNLGQVEQILLWAVAPNALPPIATNLDEDALVELTSYHRITALVLRRLEEVRPTWCRPRLMTRLRTLNFHERQRTKAQVAVAKKLSVAMLELGEPAPIWIKGFSGYALTNVPDALHYSGDLDPFASDLPKLWNVFQSLGYTGKRKDSHEWAKMWAPEAQSTIDVHQYFPILAYPDEVLRGTAKQLDAVLNPGHWHLAHFTRDLIETQHRIVWDDLHPTAAYGVAPGMETLRFPDPTLATIIHCAHCFRSSVTRLHYMTPLGGMRFYELITVRALSQSPAFNASVFRELVDRYDAQDAVRFVNTLATAYLGTPLLPYTDSESSRDDRFFPEHLIYGGWTATQNADDWMVQRGIEYILTKLGASIIGPRFSGVPESLDRVLTFGIEPPKPRLTIDWDVSSQVVHVEWRFPKSSDTFDLLVHFGCDSYVQVRVSGDAVSTVEQKGDFLLPDQRIPDLTSIETTGADLIIRMKCPIPHTPRFLLGHDESKLLLMLAIRRLNADGESEGVSYFPLIIQSLS